MRRATRLLLLATVLLLITGARGQAASAPVADGGYDLSWFTVDGGASTLNGDGTSYALGGTAGQPDAAVWQGHGYSLLGGFWGGWSAEHIVYLPLVLRDS